MRFLNPDVLWNLLWILPLMVLIAVTASRKRTKKLTALLGKHADDPAFVSVSKPMRTFRFLLLLVIVVCLIAAIARPTWGVQIQESQGRGRDLLFVMDVSKSMLCKDVQPSRLAHAKWLAAELVKLNPNDRFALIAFAGKAFLECPMTADKTSFLQNVNELDVNSIPVGGTNVQAALETALTAFKAAESQNRAIVLITDGDELEGNSGSAVEQVIKRKIPLFVVGVGDPTQPAIIQVQDESGKTTTLRDEKGNIVNAALNETQLAMLASKSGGIYVRSTASETGLSQLEKRIRALAPEEYETVKTTKPIDRFIYPLIFAFLLFLAYLSLPERKLRVRTPGIASIFFVCLLLPLSSPAKDVPTNKKDEVVSKTETVPPKAETSAEIYNVGVEFQKKGEVKNAVEKYQTALASDSGNAELRAKTSQNLGVITHAAARAKTAEAIQKIKTQKLDDAQKSLDESLKILEQAESMYRESMRDSSEWEAVSKNQTILLKDRERSELLKKKIEELKKKQQQAQKQTQDAKNQQQKQNQQKSSENQSAEQKTEQARKSAEELKNHARNLEQKNMEKNAEQAQKELEKAREEQKKGNGKSAEEHLKKALESLGKNQPPRDSKSNPEKQDQKKQDKSDKNKPDQQKQPDEKLPQPQQGPSEQPKPEEGKIDKQQAEALLENMSQDEKNLRDAIKAYQKKNSKIKPSAKDW